MNPPADHRLPPRQQWVARDKWPLVGEQPLETWPDPWRLDVGGASDAPQSWTLSELQRLPSVTRTMDIHCVTRWSKADVTWTGVRLLEVLSHCQVQPRAQFASFVAHSSRDHATSLSLTTIEALDPILAWAVDGDVLSRDHGGPLRLVTPGRYFYKSLKWLRRIELLEADRLGYWEAEAGYHNGADPWAEQRYAASRLTKREVQALLASRQWGAQDLMGFQGAHRELDGLKAVGTRLRDADFSQARLRAADFTRANLSNANFRQADLRDACFQDADLEGADFAGADLRGARFQNASVFGATFCDPSNDEQPTASLGAQFTIPVPLTEIQRSMLTLPQQQYLAELDASAS